jgi:archaeosine synthase beta-subunit
VSVSVADRRIRSLRAPKPAVDAWKAHGALVETERRPGGSVERTCTIFLAGSECPFTCSFCDLWRYTIDGPTPAGALPRQIGAALASLDAAAVDRVKLYNASNFFDRRAVPAADVPLIAALCEPFGGVTVESHASTVGPLALEFAGRLRGRLEVAIGLETVHRAALARLNKRLDLDRFERAARFLADNAMDLRVFVLLGAPNVPAAAAVEWAVRGTSYAAERGAAVVSIVPVRGGNGELERLAALGRFAPPTLRQLEQTLDACAGIGPDVVTADLWDAERLDACHACRLKRLERMGLWNATGIVQPPVACQACANGQQEVLAPARGLPRR